MSKKFLTKEFVWNILVVYENEELRYLDRSVLARLALQVNTQ